MPTRQPTTGGEADPSISPSAEAQQSTPGKILSVSQRDLYVILAGLTPKALARMFVTCKTTCQFEKTHGAVLWHECTLASILP